MTITPTYTTAPLIEVVARAAVQAKEAKEATARAWDDAEQDVIMTFIDNDMTSITLVEDDGTFTRVTVKGLEETRQTVDADKAAQLLTAEQFAMITKVAIDTAALNAAIACGAIPAALAAQFIDHKQVKPSVRITHNAKG